MKYIKTSIICCTVLLLVFKSAGLAGIGLQDYVDIDDSTFEYSLVSTTHSLFHTTYVLDITSQTWHADDVDPGTWEHWLTIVEPRLNLFKGLVHFSLVQSDKALLQIIKGDSDHEDRPDSLSFDHLYAAYRNHSVVAVLHGVPIGPVAFLDEQEDPDLWDELNPFLDEEDDLVLRAENSFLARSFDLALITEDYSWATLFPMVKAVVRSMDVLQEFLKQINGGKNIVNEFMLVGHSKRGWTTLLTAAVDDRVNAVAALSFDFVNMAEQYALLAASWGEPGFAMSKYEEFDLSQRFLTVEGLKFLEVIDPYYYSESLDVPKLVIVGTGDPYSIVDSVNLYLDDLPGSTHIHYNPNQGHDIHKLPGTLDVISAFFRKTAKNNPMPEFEYDCSSDGSFKITGITQTPVSVKLWTATNPSARDFRVGQDPPILWSSSSDAVIKDSYNTYSGAVTDLPEEGYTAFYIEMIFKDGIKNLDKSYSLATPVKVIGE